MDNKPFSEDSTQDKRTKKYQKPTLTKYAKSKNRIIAGTPGSIVGAE